MMKTLHSFLLAWFFATSFIKAQPTPQPALAHFSATPENGGIRFRPQCPPLVQRAGAPAAFYTYYWEFGDGDFSFEESPLHRYENGGPHQALLAATAHYDDKQKPPKPKSQQVFASTGAPGALRPSHVFTKTAQAIALKTNQQPAAGEEIICIISYRNNSIFTTDGRLHLFFNERKFPATHFTFLNARTHFGEKNEAAYTQAPPQKALDWDALFEGIATAGNAAPLFFAAPPSSAELLQKARQNYREEQAWRFTSLKPGEQRNLFVSLQGTDNMLKDTSAFIHLKGVFAPFDPAVSPEEFTLEIEIVSSHDPNAIAVSDNRVSYRNVGRKNLDYKVRFQNNGEGPAQKVELTVTLPEGLNASKMRPIKWYPECPICTTPPQPSGCLDTATTRDGLVFTFRNIYLPGSRQKGVSDYDSTQGFVRYRIEPHKDMPKRPFRSQASIVFDKNKPVLTNFSKTRFKPGLSPGLKMGYAFQPDSSDTGYFFFGASLSPYKSWRIYPQVELLTGVKGRTDLTERLTLLPGDISQLMGDLDTLVSQEIRESGSRGFFSLEVPVLLRKNFTKFIGVGIGGSARVLFEDGEDRRQVTTTRTPYRRAVGPTGVVEYLQMGDPVTTTEPSTQDFSETNLRFSLFADLTLGSVRAGPNVGIRAGGILLDGFQPFVQASFEYKF